MSDVNKENPVAEETTIAPATSSADKVEESLAASASPAQISPPEAVKHAATDAAPPVSDKATKIFGAFTTETPKKDEAKETTTSSTSTPSAKPLFGGFTTGTTSASAWSAPSTLGGFGSASLFTPKKDEEKEEVLPGLAGS